MSSEKDPAAEAYGSAVAEIIAAQPRPSSWRPDDPLDLTVVRAKKLARLADLGALELEQLRAMCGRCWDELEGKKEGTLRSEPHIRALLRGDLK